MTAPLQLSDKEQSVLDAAGLTIVLAEQRMRDARQQAEDAQATVTLAMARLQGTFHAVLQLRDLNPDAYRAEWSVDAQRIIITQIAVESAEPSP